MFGKLDAGPFLHGLEPARGIGWLGRSKEQETCTAGQALRVTITEQV